MPHLPPVEINGGSVTIQVPVNEVNAQGEVLGSLFKTKKPVIETYPNRDDCKSVREREEHVIATHSNGNDYKALREIEERVLETYPKGKNYKSLFARGEPVIGTHPNGKDYETLSQNEGADMETHQYPARTYTIQRYKAPEAQIYLVEIYGASDSEVFEFRPKNGKCKIKVYYAGPEERDEVEGLMKDREWPPANI